MTPIDQTVDIAQSKLHPDLHHPRVMISVLAELHIFREAPNARQDAPPEQGATGSYADPELAIQRGSARRNDRARLVPDTHATKDRIDVRILYQRIQHGPMPVWTPQIVMVQKGDKLTARGIKSGVARC
jgi:hypothetical protein